MFLCIETSQIYVHILKCMSIFVCFCRNICGLGDILLLKKEGLKSIPEAQNIFRSIDVVSVLWSVSGKTSDPQKWCKEHKNWHRKKKHKWSYLKTCKLLCFHLLICFQTSCRVMPYRCFSLREEFVCSYECFSPKAFLCCICFRWLLNSICWHDH